MCSIMAAVGIVSALTTVASTAFSIAQSKQQTADKQAVSSYNTVVAENEAQDTRVQANEAENAQRSKTATLLSRQRAQIGAANIALDSGSALQLQEDTLTLGEVDALRIRNTGDSRFESSMSQAGLESAKGEMAGRQGDLNTAGALLTGGSRIASSVGTGVSNKWFTNDSVSNPFITDNNPLGLTYGQGL